MTKYNKLWPIVDGNGIIVGASSAPDDAKDYLTWKEWVSLQGTGKRVKFSSIEGMMKKDIKEVINERKH